MGACADDVASALAFDRYSCRFVEASAADPFRIRLKKSQPGIAGLALSWLVIVN
jgi:hypothetical protein